MHVGEDKSRRRYLKNGVPQGSVLAPILFNIYTADLPSTDSKKYIYADDIALMTTNKAFPPIEATLSDDLDSMSTYFDNWRLKLNIGKTVCTSFHLAHRLASYQLQVKCKGNPIPCDSRPKYLGITLDRTLTYKQHLDDVSHKVTARNNLLRKLAGLTWGAHFSILRTTAVCLAYAPAEYCAPTWSHSCHTNKVDISLNATMRIVTGCLKSTPTPSLHVASGIQPPDIRRSKHTLKLSSGAKAEPTHLLHDTVCKSEQKIPLRLSNKRRSFSTQLQTLSSETPKDPNVWASNTSHSRWQNDHSTLRTYIRSPKKDPWTRPS
jgi:hypothetical protein